MSDAIEPAVNELLSKPGRLRTLHPDRSGVGTLEHQLLLAKDLGWLQVQTFQAIANETIEVKRMLAGLLARLRADG